MDGRDLQLVYLDAFLVDRLRINTGLSLTELASKADMEHRTLMKGVYKAAGLLPKNAKSVADFFETEVVKLLSPDDPRYRPSEQFPGPATGSDEWDCKGYLDQGRQTPNGLYVIVCRMKHRHTQGRSGRGKYYHLSWLSTAVKDELRHKLSRHADICFRVGPSPHVATNLVSTPATMDEGWWVIDDWVGEKTLADHLEAGPWPTVELPRLLEEIARGLDHLHRADVIVRELAPARILLSDADNRAVLTDFELAKLLDGSPSVSSDWPDDPFRAPEIDGATATVASDLYSFGQVALAACGAKTGAATEAATVFTQAGMPKPLVKLLADCVQGFPTKRPPSIEPILQQLTRWRGKG